MLNSEVEEAIRLIQAAKVGAEPSPELAALAKENPAAYTAAIRKANSLMNVDFGDVLDLGNAENQRKFLTNDPPPPFDKTAKEEQKLWRNYMLDYSTKVERWERPNTLDRLVALDTFVAVTMCGIGTWAAYSLDTTATYSLTALALINLASRSSYPWFLWPTGALLVAHLLWRTTARRGS